MSVLWVCLCGLWPGWFQGSQGKFPEVEQNPLIHFHWFNMLLKLPYLPCFSLETLVDPGLCWPSWTPSSIFADSKASCAAR